MSEIDTEGSSIFRENMEPFCCCEDSDVAYWARGGPRDTWNRDPNWRWAFCAEAHRPVCEQLRMMGLCVRSLREWGKLLDDDGRRA
jgi:hypothetical protein